LAIAKLDSILPHCFLIYILINFYYDIVETGMYNIQKMIPLNDVKDELFDMMKPVDLQSKLFARYTQLVKPSEYKFSSFVLRHESFRIHYHFLGWWKRACNA